MKKETSKLGEQLTMTQVDKDYKNTTNKPKDLLTAGIYEMDDLNYFEDDWNLIERGGWRKQSYFKDEELEKAKYLYWLS